MIWLTFEVVDSLQSENGKRLFNSDPKKASGVGDS